MKPRLWLLAILAVLIWLAILIQHQMFRPSEPPPVSAQGEQQPLITPTPVEPSYGTSPAPSLLAAVTDTLGQPPAATPTSSPTPLPVYHQVQPGEVPGVIAAAYDISVELLMKLNNITDPTALQIGQRLLIPVTITPTPATPQPSPSPTPEPRYYVIQKGDVLLTIAAEYDTTVEAIMIANNISDPRSLQIGQRLFIPADKGSILGVPTKIHEIKGGDTLLGLATLYGSTLEDILATNPELEPERLKVGQKIAIPLTQPKFNPNADPTQPRITSPAAPSPNYTSLEEEMVAAVNAARQSQGLPALTVDENLTIVARAHGQDMVSRGYFSHVTPEGITLDGRLQEHGLNLNWSGENIQRNVQAPSATVQYAANWFMNSRPHRQNILHSRYSRLGVSVTEGPPGWYTFVLVFGGD